MRTDLTRGRGDAERVRDDDLGRRLRALPDPAGPPFDFTEWKRRTGIADRLGGRRVAVRMGGWAGRIMARWPVPGLAVAALVVLATGLVVGIALHHDGAGSRGVMGLVQEASPVTTPASMPVGAEPADRGLQRPRRALVRADSQLAVMALEDRIAVVDDQLNAARLLAPRAQRVQVLQRDRAQLVQSLAQVRYAQDLVEAQ